MFWQRKSRLYHKWLMLFVGLQCVIWSITGAYMVVLNIDYIHGDSLVKQPILNLSSTNVNYGLHQLYGEYPKAEEIELTLLMDRAVYRFSENKQRFLLSADTGKLLSPISEDYAVAIAKQLYQKAEVTINHVSLISENPPFELSRRHLPVWRIDFDDFASPSFYISSRTGKLVTKRHTFWRVFDWMFSFHVMDYVEEDASNKLLLIFSILALMASLFGVVLTYFKIFSNRKKNKSKPKAKPKSHSIVNSQSVGSNNVKGKEHNAIS